jgi:hypothetical protein
MQKNISEITAKADVGIISETVLFPSPAKTEGGNKWIDASSMLVMRAGIDSRVYLAQLGFVGPGQGGARARSSTTSASTARPVTRCGSWKSVSGCVSSIARRVAYR